jgi:hypothetical protein
VITRYRTHEEQIASIAQTMRELYHVRRDDSNANDVPGTGNSAVSQDISDEIGERNPRFSVRNTTKNVKTLKSRKHQASGTDSAPAQQSLSAIKCFRCGDAFPVTDFLYTKESGLCIPCWESKKKVMKCR